MLRFKEELVKALTRARLQIEAKPDEGKTDPKINTEPELRGRKATDQFKEELVARLQLRLNQKEVGKTDMEPELRGREVCQQPSGFMSSWLICSLNFDKYFPKRFPRANRKQ